MYKWGFWGIIKSRERKDKNMILSFIFFHDERHRVKGEWIALRVMRISVSMLNLQFWQTNSIWEAATGSSTEYILRLCRTRVYMASPSYPPWPDHSNMIWQGVQVKEPGYCSRYSDWLRAARPKGRSPSPGRVKNFLFSTASRPALGPSQPPTQWVLGTVSPVVKRPGHEADHSPPASAEIKKMWICRSTSPCAFMA
jgi:hypothetical protein